jgi:hypothetical protein
MTWRSIRSDVVPRVLWGLPENIAADIRLVGPWRSLSGPCDGPLRTSTCIVTRQPSVRMTWSATSAALADIRSQRTMPSACGGALPASSALRTEPASVPVSFRPPGCSPTTDLARFGSGPQVVGQFRASRQDSARTLVRRRCEWLLTRPVARSAAWASSTSSSRPKPPKIGFEHRIGRPRSLMGRSSVAPSEKGAPKAITSPDMHRRKESIEASAYTRSRVFE